MAESEQGVAAGKAFLRACQRNELEEAQRLLAEWPHVIESRSASKGYGPAHWAAMGGSTETIEVMAAWCSNPHASLIL